MRRDFVEHDTDASFHDFRPEIRPEVIGNDARHAGAIIARGRQTGTGAGGIAAHTLHTLFSGSLVILGKHIVPLTARTRVGLWEAYVTYVGSWSHTLHTDFLKSPAIMVHAMVLRTVRVRA